MLGNKYSADNDHFLSIWHKINKSIDQLSQAGSDPLSECDGERDWGPTASDISELSIRNRTGEERRRQTLCDKHDINFVWKNVPSNFTLL